MTFSATCSVVGYKVEQVFNLLDSIGYEGQTRLRRLINSRTRSLQRMFPEERRRPPPTLNRHLGKHAGPLVLPVSKLGMAETPRRRPEDWSSDGRYQNGRCDFGDSVGW